MRVTKIYTSAAFIATAAFFYSCTSKKGDTPNPANPNPVTCDMTNVTYSGVINPIIQQNCAVSGCHTNAMQAGGYSYQTFAGLKSAVNNNRLLGAINHLSGFVPMPQSAAKLSDCDIEKITQWVAMGALNN